MDAHNATHFITFKMEITIPLTVLLTALFVCYVQTIVILVKIFMDVFNALIFITSKFQPTSPVVIPPPSAISALIIVQHVRIIKAVPNVMMLSTRKSLSIPPTTSPKHSATHVLRIVPSVITTTPVHHARINSILRIVQT